VVAGGMGTMTGPTIGAVLFVLIDQVLGAAAGQGVLILGLLSIVLVLAFPRGVMGCLADIRHPKARRRRSAGRAQWRRWLLGEDAQTAVADLVDRPGVVAAYLVPGSAMLALEAGQAPHESLIDGMAKVAEEIRELEPDALLIYSTRWCAVLDQPWQGRPVLSGIHVDEDWHELGEWRFELRTDVSLAKACVRAANHAGLRSRLVDYDGFPLDSGTLCAQALLNPQGSIPTLVVANNLYRDFETTRRLGDLAASQAAVQGKRVVVVGVGGLSGHGFRDLRSLAHDRIATPLDDQWNRRILDLIERHDIDAVLRHLPEFDAQARVDMGFKHFAFALGAIGGRLREARVLGYGPQYGAGAAVVRLS
jgi:2-aminophenol/2-amino-5-chlorophenol 1,6-dioxygenase alpha subunit